MSRHLKTSIMNRLDAIISCYKQLPPKTSPRARGVRYFVPIDLYKAYWGAMNTIQEGHKYHKHIIALDPSRHYTPAFRHRTANDSAHKWLRQYAIDP